jgi:hypothetical protein
MRRGSWLIAIAAPCLLATAAHADEATERARAAYAEGESLSRARRYGEAAAAFAEADALAPNDTALEAALEAALLAEDAPLGMNLVERSQRTPTASQLPAVDKVRRTFERRAGLVVIRCMEEQPPCEARVDDQAAARARVWLAAGPHRVVMRRDGREATEPVTASPGTTIEVAFPAEGMAAPPPVVGPAVDATPPPVADDSSGGISPWWFAAGCAVTATLGVVTIVHGLAAGSAHDDFDAANGRADRATLEALAADGESLDTRTNVFLALTAVAGAGTAALGIFAVDWSGDAPGEASLVPGPDGFRLRAAGTF